MSSIGSHSPSLVVSKINLKLKGKLQKQCLFVDEL